MAPLLENPKSFSLHSPKRFGEPPILESRPSGGPNSFEATDLLVPSSANGIGDLNEVISQNRRLRGAALSRNSHDGGGIVFGRETMTQNSGSKRVFRGVVKIATGAATTQLDSPLPGPADVVGAGIISSGVKDVGLGFLQLILPKSSFELPKDWPNRDEESKCKRGHVLHRAVPRAEKQSIEYEGKPVLRGSISHRLGFKSSNLQTVPSTLIIL